MAKTLDHISGGRLILGIGAGWFERDYKEYGYTFGTAPDRLRALGEALPIIKHRWEVEVPAPTRAIPILVGGGGEKVTLKLTAQYANIWNSFGPPETYQHKSKVLDEWCAKVGRNPADIERSVALPNTDELDAFLAVGATHIIINLSDPWNFDEVEKLVRWRDSQK
jgi:alkanesulfonate monooxygenase SsuD/methylene tetrahydromethanopterin reductase-like flavin-dependent oxidoreductase (luciferase family)